MNQCWLRRLLLFWVVAWIGLVQAAVGSPAIGQAAVSVGGSPNYLSPTALAASPDGRWLYIACATANRISAFEIAEGRLARDIQVPSPPLGLALSKDGLRLYATCAAPLSTVCVIDTATDRVIEQLPAGHTAMAPVLNPNGRKLYICNRFEDSVSAIDLDTGQEAWRAAVPREPFAAAVTPDGMLLLVANHLHKGRSDGGVIGAVVTALDSATGCPVGTLQLPRGTSSVRGIAISPDGRFAAVTHLIGRYYLTASEVEFGQINANALSLIDLNRLKWIRVVYLDAEDRGAANPWAVAWTPDGQRIVVTHAGSHEVTMIEAPVLPQRPVRVMARVAVQGNGPRALAFAGGRVFIANYFSDSLTALDLARLEAPVETFQLGAVREPDLVRHGEALFNDATLCYQQWQSCASCHDSDGRIDGLNWDLLNDGRGNPKNAKSLVWAHRTPPAMALGVRSNAEAAVRAGLRSILFADQPENVAAAIDEYLRSLEPAPSPYLCSGELSAAAERGRILFMDETIGCARCHPPPLFTDLKQHNVGTQGPHDQAGDRFDTPALVELWRTAPYLHDGSVARVREVLTTRNPDDRHGQTSHLNPAEIDDLVAFLLSI